MRGIVTIFLYTMYATSATAGQLIHSSVEHDKHRYILEFEMQINASPQRVYELITDYNNLDQLSDSIKKSKLLSSKDEHHHRVRVVSNACVLFFCKTIRQVQDIEEINKQIVIATVIPQQSDFDYAHARWHIQKQTEGTRVTFNVDLKPSFWVPPLIGPAIIKNKLEKEVRGTIENLERLASKHDTNSVQ